MNLLLWLKGPIYPDEKESKKTAKKEKTKGKGRMDGHARCLKQCQEDLNFTKAWNRLRPSNTTNQSDTHVQVLNYVGVWRIVCNLITEGHGRYSTDMNPKKYSR